MGVNAQVLMDIRDEIIRTFDYRDGGLWRKTTGLRGYMRDDGYVYVRLGGKSYGEHRLVHHLFTGEWPKQVDHRNGCRSDNRPENLRGASHAQNCQNRKPIGKHGKGVYWIPKRARWMVQIGTDGTRKTVGYYMEHADAVAAYAKASREIYGEFARS